MLGQKPLFQLREPRGLDAVTQNIRNQLQRPAPQSSAPATSGSLDEHRRSAMQSYMKKKGEVPLGY